MNRVAHVRLQVNQPVEARRGLLLAIPNRVNAATGNGKAAEPALDAAGEPYLEVVLPEELDEDTFQARICGLAWEFSIHADAVDLTFGMAEESVTAAIVRLSLASPLDLDERNDEYERLKAFGPRLGWPVLHSHMGEAGVVVDLLLEQPRSAQDLSQIIEAVARVAPDLGANLDRVTVQVLPDGGRSRELREPAVDDQPAVARLDIRPARLGEMSAIGLARAIARHLCWRELARASGTGGCTTWLEIPAVQRTPERAMPAISSALATTGADSERVSAALLTAEEAVAELVTGDPGPPHPGDHFKAGEAQQEAIRGDGW